MVLARRTPPVTRRRAASRRPSREWIRGGIVLLLGALLLAGCATLDHKQREWVFQPSKTSWAGAAWAAEDMHDVWIDFHSREADTPVTLHGLWLPQADADAPVLLYLHGARWDVKSSAHRMRRMHELGFAVLGIDYRGFGRSTDMLPSETMAYEDALAAWRWLAQQHPQARRYVFGHSLGGAIAVHVASEVDDAEGLIVEGTFTSIPDVVKTYDWGWLPVGPLITQRFDGAARIAKLRVPVLVVHGSADRRIRPEVEPKRWLLVDGGSHHNTNAVGQPLYREAIAERFGLAPRTP